MKNSIGIAFTGMCIGIAAVVSGPVAQVKMVIHLIEEVNWPPFTPDTNGMATIAHISPRNKKVSIASASDFAKYKIGTIPNGAPEQLLVKAGADSTKLDRTAKVDGNILKFQSGRIDAFAINVLSAQYEMKKMNINWEEYEIVYTLKEGNLCYAFHKDVDQKKVDAINGAMAKLKASSVFDTIIKKYL
jgi:polar amino acid transport system substrate-binding protein